MAITTVSQLKSSLLQPLYFVDSAGSGGTSGSGLLSFTSIYTAGAFGTKAAPSSGMSGAALTSSVGCPTFINPASGNTYLASLRLGTNNALCGMPVLCDRLWESSGIGMTTLTAQTVNSVAWPARDINQSTDGEGVYIALEVQTGTGAGTPSVSISYTNSQGTAGRTGTSFRAGTANSGGGTWLPITLQAGDTGVRSVQTVTLSATWTSGSAGLVAFRPICFVDNYTEPAQALNDAITLAMPQLFNNSVLFFVHNRNDGGGSAATSGGPAQIILAQG